MKEEVSYVNVGESSVRKIFLHSHIPDKESTKAFVFFSSIIDEKKRSQKFEAQTARSLCNENYYVFRFDYFATGDSFGDLSEFNLLDSINDAFFLINHLKDKFLLNEIKFLGTRIGADIALLIGQKYQAVRDLILIDPIVKGRRFLAEQRLRRKTFHKLNNMEDAEDFIIVNKQRFEDFQGYLFSKDVLKFIDNLNTEAFSGADKNITIFKAKSSFSKKLIENLVYQLDRSNTVRFRELDYKDFWASFEVIQTTTLTKEITSLIK